MRTAVPPPPPPGNSLNGQPIPPLGPPPGPAPEAAAGAPAERHLTAVAPPANFVAPPAPDGAVPAAPSAFGTTKPGAGPTVAVAQYNPRTGEYVGSDGKLYKVTNVVAGTPLTKTWKDLLLH